MASKFNPKEAIVVGFFTTVIGTPVALFGIWWGAQSFLLLLGAGRTTGTVVSVTVQSQGGGGTTRVVPVVEYHVGGKQYTAAGTVGISSLGRKRKGDKVTVYFWNDRPDAGYLNTFSDRWACPLFFGGLGSLFAAIGIHLVRYGRRRA